MSVESIPLPEHSESEESVAQPTLFRYPARSQIVWPEPGKWAEEDGQYRSSDIRIMKTEKRQENQLDTVKGCMGGLTNFDIETGRPYGCHWGCYALYKARTLGGVNYSIPVPLHLNEELLRKDLQKMDARLNWVGIGTMGDPCGCWDTTCRTCEIIADEGKQPVVLSRLWGKPPSSEQLRRLQAAGTLLHITICALDSSPFLDRRRRVCETYLALGGNVALRPVTFYFDPLTERGIALWQRQDHLMSGKFGAIPDKAPMILETPARMMTGNPTWGSGEIYRVAYYHSPTTREHLENRHNHWWTAGPLYPEQHNCWIGCKDCSNQCMTNVTLLTE